MNNDFSVLNEYLKDFDIVLSERQIEQFHLYYDLLIEWNTVMNLTTITEFEDVLVKHFTDSVSIVMFYQKYGVKESIENTTIVNHKFSPSYVRGSLADIGTGAGFPGIPIKILFPNLNVTLMDSLQKRVNFLSEVVNQLGLANVKVIHTRAEDAGKNSLYREKFDYVVSRAVSNMTTLSEYCLPFVNMNGYFIAYKSEHLNEELSSANKAIEVLGGKAREQIEFNLPKTNIYRNLFVIQKVNITPTKYPRKAGLPLKEPIA